MGSIVAARRAGRKAASVVARRKRVATMIATLPSVSLTQNAVDPGFTFQRHGADQGCRLHSRQSSQFIEYSVVESKAVLVFAVAVPPKINFRNRYMGGVESLITSW